MQPLPYSQAVDEYNRLTQPGQPFAGMGKRDFAKAGEDILGYRRYNTLDKSALDALPFHFGRFIDWVGATEFGLNALIPGDQSASGMGKWALGNLGEAAFGEEKREFFEGIGKELPGTIMSLAAFGVPVVGPYLGLSMAYSDAYNDALEAGNSPWMARGSGALMAAFGGGLKPLGNVLTKGATTGLQKANQRATMDQLAALGYKHPEVAETIAANILKVGGKKVPKMGGGYFTRGGKTVFGPKGKSAFIKAQKYSTEPYKNKFAQALFKTPLDARASLIKEAGISAYGVAADIADATFFNEFANASDLLQDPAYWTAILAGDAVGYGMGEAISSRFSKAHQLRSDKVARLDKDLKLGREKLAELNKTRLRNLKDGTEPELAPFTQPDLEVVEGKVTPEGTKIIEGKVGEETLVSMKTDRSGKLLEMDVSDPSMRNVAMIMLMNHFKGEPFDYVSKGDGSDSTFINEFLERYGSVKQLGPTFYTVYPHKMKALADTAHAAGRFPEHQERLPAAYSERDIMARFIAATEYTGIPHHVLRSDAKRMFDVYKRNGASDETAMRMTLRAVESKHLQNFYNIYYGKKAPADVESARLAQYTSYKAAESRIKKAIKEKRRPHSADLQRVADYKAKKPIDTSTIHREPGTNRDISYIQRQAQLKGRGKLNEHIFFHDSKARRTYTVEYSSPDGGRTMQQVHREYVGGVEQRQLSFEELSMDAKAGLELAIGEYRMMQQAPKGVFQVKETPFGQEATRVVTEVLQGMGFGDTTVFILRPEDLTNLKALKEIGAEYLAQYANLAPRSGGHQFQLATGQHVVVVNPRAKISRGAGLRQNVLMHEIGHVVEKEVLNRPEFADIKNELLRAWGEQRLKSRKSKGGNIKEFLSPVRRQLENANIKGVSKKEGGGGVRKFPQNKNRVELPDGTTAMRPLEWEELTGFHEWFAEQWVKHASRPSTKVGTVVQRFFHELAKLWRQLVHRFKGYSDNNPTFNKFMKERGEEFFTRIVNEQAPSIMQGMKERYNLLPHEMEEIARPLYRSDYDMEFFLLLDSRLSEWQRRSKSTSMKTLVNNVRRDHKKKITSLLEVARQDVEFSDRIRELDEVFLQFDEMAHTKYVGEGGDFKNEVKMKEQYGIHRKEYIDILKTIDKALHGFYLPRETSKPAASGGGIGAFKLNRRGNWIPETTARGKEVPIHYYKTLQGAERRINKMELEGGAGWEYTVHHRKEGYYIQRKMLPGTKEIAQRSEGAQERHFTPAPYQGNVILEATTRAQEVFVKWAMGELTPQKGVERGGGTELLYAEIVRATKPVKHNRTEILSLSSDGEFRKGGDRMTFETEEMAEMVASQMADKLGNEGYSYQVRSQRSKSDKRLKWYVYRIYDEFLARARFDEEFMDANGMIGESTGSGIEQVRQDYGESQMTWLADDMEASGIKGPVMHMRDASERAAARAYPLQGQKTGYLGATTTEKALSSALHGKKRVVDAFSGSGSVSTWARSRGFEGPVVENTFPQAQFELKSWIRQDPVGFQNAVRKHYQVIEDMTPKEAASYLKKQSDTDLGALWLAQVFQAHSRELATPKGLSLRSDRFGPKRFENYFEEAVRYSMVDTRLTQADGWSLLKDASGDELFIVDPPYVGRDQYGGQDRRFGSTERLADLEAVWTAKSRGANIVYFDNSPRIRQEFENRGWLVQTIKGDEFVAYSHLKQVPESYSMKDVAMEEARDTVQMGMMNDLLPPHMHRLFEEALEELGDLGEHVLRSFGTDLGMPVATLADLMDAVMVQSTKDPKKFAKVFELMPPQTKNAVQAVLDHTEQIFDQIETTVRKAGLKLEDMPEKMSDLTEERVKLAQHVAKTKDLSALTTVTSRMEPGGIRVAEMKGNSKFGRLFSSIEKLYYETFGGAQHLSEAHPLVHEAGVALHTETGTQNRIYSEVADQFHTTAPPNPLDPSRPVDMSISKDRAYRRVAESAKLSHAYDQIKLLEQVSEMGAGDLMKKRNVQFLEATKDLSGDELSTVMELVERSHRAQITLSLRRYEVMKQVDVISAAKRLTRLSEGHLTSGEAVGVIEQLEIIPDFDERAMLVTQEAGIDLKVAEQVVAFHDALANASFETHKFLMERPWYVSERRMKRYHVSYKYKGDKTTSRADFDSPEEAKVFLAEAKADGAEIIGGKIIDTQLQQGLRGRASKDLFQTLQELINKKKSIVNETIAPFDEDLSVEIQDLFDELESSMVLEQEAQSPLATLKGGKGKDKTRKFKGGREFFNMLEQQLEHSRRTAVALARRRTDALFSLTRSNEDVKTSYGENLMRLMDKARDNQRRADPKLGLMASKFNFATFLGFNVGTGLIEMLQFPTTLSPILLEMGASWTDAMATPTKHFLQGKALRSALSEAAGRRKKDPTGSHWKGEHAEIIRRAEKEGRLNIRRYIDIDDDIVMNQETSSMVAQGDDLRGKLSAARPFKTAYHLAAKMYAPFNLFNAEISLVSCYDVLKKKHPDWGTEKLYLEAVRWADIANGSAGKSNRPIGWFGGSTDFMRSAAQASYGLMSFTNAQIGNWMRWIKKSNADVFTGAEKKGARKALAYAVGANLLGLGVMGLPMVGSIATLFNALFGFDLEDTIREWLTNDEEQDGSSDYWANFANYGLMHASGFHPDVQTRLAIGGLGGFNPYQGWHALGLLGPMASFVESTLVALQQFPKQGVAKTLTNVGPIGLRRGINLLLDDGMMTDRMGNFIMEPTAGETAAMILGFTPRRARRQAIRNRELERAKVNDRRMADMAAHEATKRYKKGDLMGARQVLMARSEQHPGKSYADLYASFESKYLKQVYGRDYEKGGTTAERISTLGGVTPPMNTQVYLHKLGLRNQFGFDAEVSEKEFQVNVRADQLRQRIPYLTPSMAKMLARQETEQNPLRQKYRGGQLFTP